MCTVSLVPGPGGILITMNRDERRQRTESPPRHVHQEGCDYWCTTDSLTGGSWFGINQSGMLALLINRYQNFVVGPVRQSRGVLVPQALHHASPAAALQGLAGMAWTDFDGFELILVRDDQLEILQWDGRSLEQSSMQLCQPKLLISSSVDYEAARAWRQQAFMTFLTNESEVDAAKLLQLHRQGCSEHPSLGIFMQREHSHTKSISQALLNDGQIAARYLPHSALQQSVQAVDWQIAYSASTPMR